MPDLRLLIVPGLNNSGPEHWQTRWESKFAHCTRVQQRDWAEPRREDWVATLDAAIHADASPCLLIAHSLGVIAIAHWAAAHPRTPTPRRRAPVSGVQGALLVAPPWLERPDAVPAVRASFTPLPMAALPFRSLLVASSNDPYGPLANSRALAAAWGSELVEVGALGHINADSGLGDWPQGQALLRRLMTGH
ncbi:MAG: alpha/beta hydrolase [Thermoflexales bacterium]|nr:alpha/beta hydrolase [Thermoflexales bacterium]